MNDCCLRFILCSSDTDIDDVDWLTRHISDVIGRHLTCQCNHREYILSHKNCCTSRFKEHNTQSFRKSLLKCNEKVVSTNYFSV